ncbi:MAG: ABC-2 transporter permease [Oscillospiraceae bacterium]|nr:ABC-2 transporter permease [Oscillospiraceae bacterium]
MKKIFDLMKVDLITMNGGKNNLKIIAVLIVVFCGFTGFCISPIAGVECPFLMSAFFVPMLFRNEQKYHSGKLWGLLPVSRRDLVNARFLLVLGLYTISSLLFYLLMLISFVFKPYYLLFGADAENMDIISLLAKSSGGSLTALGVFNLVYISGFSVGLIIAAGSLRNYFNDPDSLELSLSLGKKHKARKKYHGIELSVFAVILLLWALIVSGILPIGPTAAVIIQLFAQLAGAANGFLLGAVFITMAVFQAVYKYICTVLEYDEQEL